MGPFYFVPPISTGDGIIRPMHGCVKRDLPLPGGVDDAPRVMRRRITGKTPIHVGITEASPPPKRREWLSLLGPSRG